MRLAPGKKMLYLSDEKTGEVQGNNIESEGEWG